MADRLTQLQEAVNQVCDLELFTESIIIGSDRGDLTLSIITLLTVRSPI